MINLDGGASESIWDMLEEEKRDKIAEERENIVSIEKELERKEKIKRIIEEAYEEDQARRKFEQAQAEAFPYLDEVKQEEELYDQEYETKKGIH